MEIAQRPPHPALASHVRSLAGRHERADGPVRRAELPGGRIVLAELALDCAYYDQAHFNRDFRQFAGCTPTEYLVTSVQDISAMAA
jgi:AraC-like DNA-binding protein